MLPELRCEDSISGLCRYEGIAQSLYFSWSREFLDAGKKRLGGDTARQVNSGAAKNLRAATVPLKELAADLTLKNRLLKRHERGRGRRGLRCLATEKLEIVRLEEPSHL